MVGQIAPREGWSMLPFSGSDPMSRLRAEVDDLFSRFWGNGGEGHAGGPSFSMDLSESDKELRIQMDMPGVKPGDIDIEINGNMLNISGERKEEKQEKGRTFHRVERRSGHFSRSIMLPCEVDEDKIEARSHEGVLTIMLPKTEMAKTKRIKVQS